MYRINGNNESLKLEKTYLKKDEVLKHKNTIPK